jgi:hypothetical protein
LKPYAVAVTVGQKVSGKEFETEKEMNEFIAKAEELKKKAPSLLVRIIRRPKPKPKLKGIILNEDKEQCRAWERVMQNGVHFVMDGKQIYQCVPVQGKPKVIYCPYCHGYKEIEQVDLGHGLKEKGCKSCGVTENDFNMKTANNLWRVRG